MPYTAGSTISLNRKTTQILLFILDKIWNLRIVEIRTASLS